MKIHPAIIAFSLKFFFGGALHIGIQTSIIIMLFTIVPLAALAAFGIGGESLSQILMAYIRFSRKRRKLSYIEFSDLKSAAVESITFDMILDAFSAGGFKGIKKLFQDHKAAMANASTITAEEEEDFDRDEVIEDEEFEADAPEVTDSNGHKFSKPNIKLPKTERQEESAIYGFRFKRSPFKEVRIGRRRRRILNTASGKYFILAAFIYRR